MTTAEAGARFDFVRVLQRMFGLVARNFSLFLLVSLLLAGVPQLVLVVATSAVTSSADKGAMTVAVYALIVVLLLGTLVLQAALTRASADDLAGKAVSAGAALGAGAGVLLPMSGLLFVFLAIFGVVAGTLRYFYVFLVYSGWSTPALASAIGLGVVLLLYWIVAPPVLAVERTGVIGSLRRSAALTKGHRLAVSGLLLLYAGLVVVEQYALDLLLPGVSYVLADGVASVPAIAALVVVVSVQVLVAMFDAVGLASLYFELRQIKDGVAPGVM